MKPYSQEYLVEFINPINANFINPLIDNKFKILTNTYGFNGPVFHTAIYEYYVEYKKGINTISIYFDPWTLPFIELFRPERKIEYRKIPIIKTTIDKEYLRSYLQLASRLNNKSIIKMQKYDIERLKIEYGKYLEEYLNIFEEQEHEFLLGNDCNLAKCI
jgi:hypothetical protein